MTSLRRRLHLWVAAWLVLQAASLSALVPRDCCARHRPAATNAARGCHENTAASQCPMRAANGTPCPMHRAAADSHAAHTGRPGQPRHADHGGQPPSGKCSITGACDGPMAALFALLSNYGVLTDAFAMLPDLEAASAALPARENVVSRLASPDPPPPRA